MSAVPFPERPRRNLAVYTACRCLIANRVRLLPPDPRILGRKMGIYFVPMREASRLVGENPDAYVRLRIGEEANTYFDGKNYWIPWDEGEENQERTRFSLLHEIGHIVLDHARSWKWDDLTKLQKQILETESNTFARNVLCPPPIADRIRGDRREVLWGKLFGMSETAWAVRLEALELDREAVDRETAEALLAQFQNYLYGRRCRECGAVFTDGARLGRCPECGRSFLEWNPRMETRLQAAQRRHVTGATAEDLKPGVRAGDMREADLTTYWKLLRKEALRRGPVRKTVKPPDSRKKRTDGGDEEQTPEETDKTDERAPAETAADGWTPAAPEKTGGRTPAEEENRRNEEPS